MKMQPSSLCSFGCPDIGHVSLRSQVRNDRPNGADLRVRGHFAPVIPHNACHQASTESKGKSMSDSMPAVEPAFYSDTAESVNIGMRVARHASSCKNFRLECLLED